MPVIVPQASKGDARGRSKAGTVVCLTCTSDSSHLPSISYVRPRMYVGSSIPNLVRVALGAVYHLTDGIGLIVRRW